MRLARPFAIASLYYVVFYRFATCTAALVCTACLAYSVASPLFHPSRHSCCACACSMECFARGPF